MASFPEISALRLSQLEEMIKADERLVVKLYELKLRGPIAPFISARILRAYETAMDGDAVCREYFREVCLPAVKRFLEPEFDKVA